MNIILPPELIAYYFLDGNVLYVPWGWVSHVKWLNRDNKNLFVKLKRGPI